MRKQEITWHTIEEKPPVPYKTYDVLTTLYLEYGPQDDEDDDSIRHCFMQYVPEDNRTGKKEGFYSWNEPKVYLNVKVMPQECPLHKSFCYDSLGDYTRECPYYNGHYTDTGTVECSFNEAKEDVKSVMLNLALKNKGHPDW